MFENHVLSWIIFIPMVGIVAILLLPKGKDEMIKWVSVIFTDGTCKNAQSRNRQIAS